MDTKVKVLEIKNHYGDYYTVDFEVPKDFKWEAGQFAKYIVDPEKFNESKLSKEDFRIFSIASCMEEGILKIGIRSRGEDISDFKKKLLNLEKGSEVLVKGPMGKFNVRDKSSPMVLFASGVGITPIRSILKKIANETTRDVYVVYAGAYYLFGDEIKDIANNNPRINVECTTCVEDTVEAYSKLAEKLGNAAYYYTSGSPRVITSTREKYNSLGIEASRLIEDKFMGY